MGDRGNIVIKEGPNKIYLYTHWSGSRLEEFAIKALGKAKDRWTDGPYLARVVFQTMLGDDNGTTGFGIACYAPDNEHDILVLDTDNQTAMWESNGISRDFEKVISDGFPEPNSTEDE